MITKILSDKRPLIAVEINGKRAVMLLDTGASVGLVDLNRAHEYCFKTGSRLRGSIIGAGGCEMEVYYTKNCRITLEGLPVNEMCATDLSGIAESIRKETGIRIAGILGVTQIKQLELKINLQDGIVKIGY